MKARIKMTAALLATLSAPVAIADDSIDLSQTPIPFLKSEDLPQRVGALIEWGRGINDLGELSPGIEMPTGAVWQPAFWLYGSTRVAALSTDGDRRTRQFGDRSEIAARLDLFANLQLTGTERVQAHFRPLEDGADITSQRFSPDDQAFAFDTHTDLDAETFFFEGDIGEMFPKLDPDDRKQLDLGFAIGKLPLEFQDGYLVRDELTGVGVSKTNIQFPGSGGVRALGFWGFDHINESNGTEDDRDVDLFGVFLEGDFPWGFLEVDVATTRAGSERGDQTNFGVGWTGHAAGRNFSLRAMASQHRDQIIGPVNTRPNGQMKDYDGELMVAGFSNEINAQHDIMYANLYWANGDYGRLASNGTPPLGPVGLSFAGVGMGSYRPALWPRPLDSAGFAIGVQKFFVDFFANWAVEFAHRHDLERDDEFGETGGYALTTRLQRKFANRFLVQADAYYVRHDGSRRSSPQDNENDDDSSAFRVELKMNF